MGAGVLARHSRFRPWPLKGPGGQAPSIPTEDEITYNFDSVPALTDGNMANYVPCLVLTAWGTIKVNPTGSARLTWADMVVALYRSFDIVGAWHGRPVASNHMRAAAARIWELIAMGYASGSRHMAPIFSSEDTAQPFRHTLYIPLTLLLGDDPLYNAQLAVLFKDAQLNVQTAGVGTALPNGNTVTALTAQARCSALLVPQRVVRLGVAHEWIEYQQQGANTASNQVDMISFGNVTALDGVQPEAAIHTLIAECAAGGVGGSFTADLLTQFSAPFLGITETQHLDPFVQMLEQASGYGTPRENLTQLTTGAVQVRTQEVVDVSGFPYAQGAGAWTNDQSKLDPALLGFSMLVAGSRLQIPKLPVFGGTQSYFRTLSGSETDGDTDRTLCGQFKSWTPAKMEDFRQLVIRAGLPMAVYGTNDLVWKTELNDSAQAVNIAKTRFLPQALVPKPTAGAA